MSRRLNILRPDATVRILDRLAPKGERSRFISRAVHHYVRTRAAEQLRECLKKGALANTELDLEIAEEWFPAEQEAWQSLEREEQIPRTTPGAGKFTSRRSTRR